MASEQITKDIGRKCGDDVSAAIRRNIALVDTKRDAMIVTLYAAATAIGSASGATAAVMGGSSEITEDSIDQMWTQLLRPMMLGHFISPAAPTDPVAHPASASGARAGATGGE